MPNKKTFNDWKVINKKLNEKLNDSKIEIEEKETKERVPISFRQKS